MRLYFRRSRNKTTWDRFRSYRSGLQSPTGWNYILSTTYVFGNNQKDAERYFITLIIKVHNSTLWNTVTVGNLCSVWCDRISNDKTNYWDSKNSRHREIVCNISQSLAKTPLVIPELLHCRRIRPVTLLKFISWHFWRCFWHFSRAAKLKKFYKQLLLIFLKNNFFL